MKILHEFIHKESSSGILLIFVTILALILSNSPLAGWYAHFLHIPVEIRFGSLGLAKSLNHWVNDGLMAIFFLLIGLEVKRELFEGHLSSVKQVILPAVAAIGGMAVPALFYVFFNLNNPDSINGWAIPTATDIAFALGILALLKKDVPMSLKIFLMALAIIDDLGAIVIIALFYTSDLSVTAISVATGCVAVLFALNRFKVAQKGAYFIVGIILWVSVLKSGVHATLAGVIIAFAIPLHARKENKQYFSPLKEIEKGLHFWVAFFILPLFAFVNAGIDITQISFSQMAGPVPIGIFLGLFLGKQIGVFVFSWLAIQLKFAQLPSGSSWLQLYGVSVLTGIGFTMSLFISSLAFESNDQFQYTDRLAILAASFLAGIIGYLVLKLSARKKYRHSA